MFLLTFIAVFAILSALAYRFIRSILPEGRATSIAAMSVFAVMFLSFIIRRYLHTPPDNDVLRIFLIAGNFHVITVLYLAMSGIIIGSLAFALRAPGFFSADRIRLIRKIASYAFILLTLAVITAGYANTRTLSVVNYSLAIDSKSALKKLRIAAVSDIHAGDIIREERVRMIAEEINSLKPDCVIIAGDLFDHSADNVIRAKTLAPLASVRAPYGVYLALGNHDYFDSGDKVSEYAESLGITVLRDRAISVADALVIAGREDYSLERRLGIKRKELADIIAASDRDLPRILIDHQPNTIDEAFANEIDLQISGHTHNGQFWPVNLITDLIYNPSYGHRIFGSTNVIVTSGAGTWGPPVRTTGRCEIACIEIRFTDRR